MIQIQLDMMIQVESGLDELFYFKKKPFLLFSILEIMGWDVVTIMLCILCTFGLEGV